MTSVRMGYRIVELPEHSSDLYGDGVERARFYEVERAMDEMRREFLRRADNPPNWYLLAPNQQVLMQPDDFLDCKLQRG